MEVQKEAFQEEIECVKNLFERAARKGKRRARKFGKLSCDSELQKIREENKESLKNFERLETEKLREEKRAFRLQCKAKLELAKNEIRKEMGEELEKFKTQNTAELKWKREQILRGTDEKMILVNSKYEEFTASVDRLFDDTKYFMRQENLDRKDFFCSNFISKEQSTAFVVEEICGFKVENSEGPTSDSSMLEFCGSYDLDFATPVIISVSSGSHADKTAFNSDNNEVVNSFVRRTERKQKPWKKVINLDFRTFPRKRDLGPKNPENPEVLGIRRKRGRPRKYKALQSPAEELKNI